MVVLYIFIAIALLILFKLFKAHQNFKLVKEELRFYLMKINVEIEENPDEPYSFCRRATIFQVMQHFPKAKEDYIHALMLLDKGCPGNMETEKKRSMITNNIQYVEKPLPWSKGGAKDRSNSWITFFLIERFGKIRSIFPIRK